MKCVSGKNAFDTEELALEALIQNHIRHNHRAGSGPQNVYLCQDCGQYHFTSTGKSTSLLSDQEIIERIKKERREFEWGNF